MTTKRTMDMETVTDMSIKSKSKNVEDDREGNGDGGGTSRSEEHRHEQRSEQSLAHCSNYSPFATLPATLCAPSLPWRLCCPRVCLVVVRSFLASSHSFLSSSFLLLASLPSLPLTHPPLVHSHTFICISLHFFLGLFGSIETHPNLDTRASAGWRERARNARLTRADLIFGKKVACRRGQKTHPELIQNSSPAFGPHVADDISKML